MTALNTSKYAAAWAQTTIGTPVSQHGAVMVDNVGVVTGIPTGEWVASVHTFGGFAALRTFGGTPQSPLGSGEYYGIVDGDGEWKQVQITALMPLFAAAQLVAPLSLWSVPLDTVASGSPLDALKKEYVAKVAAYGVIKARIDALDVMVSDTRKMYAGEVPASAQLEIDVAIATVARLVALANTIVPATDAIKTQLANVGVTPQSFAPQSCTCTPVAMTVGEDGMPIRTYGQSQTII